MQAFIKGKKRGGMQEATRQVLNRAIDLLHRVSNKKVSEEIALRELTADLSTHFLAEEGGASKIASDPSRSHADCIAVRSWANSPI